MLSTQDKRFPCSDSRVATRLHKGSESLQARLSSLPAIVFDHLICTLQSFCNLSLQGTKGKTCVDKLSCGTHLAILLSIPALQSVWLSVLPDGSP